MLGFLLSLFQEKRTPNDHLWHKCSAPFFTRKTVDGGTTGLGQTWRRRTAKGWEYKQDDETVDEYYERQY